MDKALPVLIILLAPFAAAMAAYFGHVVVRGTKISELRQKWIDDQRADLAVVVSRAHLLVEMLTWGAAAKARSASISDFEQRRLTALEELEEAAFRVRLRENPTKPEWPEVLERLSRIQTLVREPASTLAQLQSLTGCMLSASQFRLKKEWNLVRDGEVSFKRAQRLYWKAVAVVTVAALAVLLLL